VGPDGAGKTTTIRLLTGLMKPDAGEAIVLGKSAAGGGLEVREAIGYMPQQYSLYGDLSVDENLRFFGRLFGLPKREFKERRKRLLHITRLTRFGDRRADALSGGMYKKLALACALLHRPKVLVLDEPTNGVDPVSRRELWELLYEFVEEGMAVLVATPYMDEAALCHRVGLIHKGILLNEDSPETMTRDFPHQVFRVSGPRRAELEAGIEARPEVLALTPHGASLRVVVRAEEEVGFTQALAATGIPHEVQPMRADFEDVFLGLMAEQTGGQK
jgi:ABC-2 type transport system ATP-binding protein